MSVGVPRSAKRTVGGRRQIKGERGTPRASVTQVAPRRSPDKEGRVNERLIGSFKCASREKKKRKSSAKGGKAQHMAAVPAVRDRRARAGMPSAFKLGVLF